MKKGASEEGSNVNDVSKAEIFSKYKTAAGIVNDTLEDVIRSCLPGQSVAHLCSKGDAFINSKCATVYTKRDEKGEKIRKGVAFPTSISVNEICCNFSPFLSEEINLSDGDLVKICLGCHIDGYVALGGHTIVVQNERREITGRKADVVLAAWNASEILAKAICPGFSSVDAQRIMNYCASAFECNVVQKVYSYELKQHIIDGVKSFMNRDVSPEEKSDVVKLEVNEVYAFDITLSTGEGRPKESDYRTCIYKRKAEQTYNLRTTNARQLLKEVSSKFPSLPFSVRAIQNETVCRLGSIECCRHNLLQPYPILVEKPGEFVAQFKFTVVLLPNGVKKIAGLRSADLDVYRSSHQLDPQKVSAFLQPMLGLKRKKKKIPDSATKDSKNADCAGEPSVPTEREGAA